MGMGREAKALNDRFVDFEDGSNGTTQAIVRSVEVVNDFTATITADSRLSLLNEKRITKPYRGSLSGAFRYYLSLVGINELILIDETLDKVMVKFGGFEGNLYEWIRQICVAKRVEISLVSDQIVVRPIRQREAVNYRNSSESVTADGTQSSLRLRIAYYEPREAVDLLVVPYGGWTDDSTIYTAEAGVTEDEVIIDLPGSFESVKQPRAVDYVSPDERGDSVYTVSGNDGLPIKARQWSDAGGSIRVSLSDDTRQLKMTITGANLPTLSPFSISMPSGTNDGYSSLRIVASGLLLEPQTIEIPTGADENKVSTDIGADVVIETISSLAEAYDAAIWSLMKQTGPVHTASVQTAGLNRRGVSGSARYPTIAEFNARYDGATIADFNQMWGETATIADFNATEFELVQSDFSNQAFGNVAGARVRLQDTYFRIRDASIAVSSVSYTGEADTTFADFDRAWSGFNIADFNKQWAGRSIQEFNVAPLQRDPLMVSSAIVGYGSGGYGRRRYGK
jgi:hypothetical protein